MIIETNVEVSNARDVARKNQICTIDFWHTKKTKDLNTIDTNSDTGVSN